MKLRVLVLCGVIIFSVKGQGNEKTVVSFQDPSPYENELFDFETGSIVDSDFFSYQEADALEEHKHVSRIDRVKQWFVDQYNYFLLRCFIFYMDLKDKKALYTSLLKSYYISLHKNIWRYWKMVRGGDDKK